MRIVLVTGSREWLDRGAIQQRLDWHHQYPGCIALYHGDCKGADHIAADLAASLAWEINRIPGWWHLGNAGGHKRNLALFHTALAWKHAGANVYVEAFPLKGGRGTQGMIAVVQKSILAPYLTITGQL